MEKIPLQMKSKIKILLVSALIFSSIIVANAAQAQVLGLNVCKGTDAEYQQYETWLLQNPAPKAQTYTDLTKFQQDLQKWEQSDQDERTTLHICTTADTYKLIARVINILISIVGIFTIFRLIYGGFVMFGFPDNEDAIKEGKRITGNAMIGMILVYAAYLVVYAMFSVLLSKNGSPTTFPFPFNLFAK